MSSAASSTVVRWRPAIAALTLLSAGLILYHLRNDIPHAHNEEPQPQLHRSNAVHRRTRQEARGRTSIAPNYSAVKISAEELVNLFRQDPDTLGERVTSILLPGHEVPLALSRSCLQALTETLQRFSAEEAQNQRDIFERALLTAFLCSRMPLNSILKDQEGKKAYLNALEKEGFESLDTVSTVLDQWNLGISESQPERQDYYERHQIPPTAVRSTFPQQPEGSDEDLLLDQAADGPDVVIEDASSSEPDEDDDDDDSEISWRHEDDDALVTEEGKKDGQTLLNMLYHIAEDQSRQTGYIHRGVSCNSCSMLPIRGIRYRCSNCPDYDLCEQCESMQSHPKTHLLYKIRVPAPFFDNSQRPQPPRYPGKLNGLPSHLPRAISKQLSHQSGREAPEIEALWDTFKCLATVEWPSDPLGFGVAIDRDCFDLCFLTSTSKTRKPPNLPMHDRIFAFFDSNNDNLIGFEEFVTGIATIRTKDRAIRLQRIFWVYDFDEDGFVCRRDFLFMFRSYYALSKELTIDMIQNMEYDILEGPNPQDIILGTQPISAAYNGTLPNPHSVKHGEGKSLNLEGEHFVADGQGVILDEQDDAADYWDIVAEVSEKAAFGQVVDLEALEPFMHGKSASEVTDNHPLLNDGWCPPFVRLEDIEAATGVRSEPEKVTSIIERRKCIETAVQRRHNIRKLGISRRRERSAFYDSRSTKYSSEAQGSSNELLQNGQATSSKLPKDKTGSKQKIPPPLEDNVGQEYLFQMLQEGLNELLDPLFKQREELAIEARKSRDLREKIREKLDSYGTPNMRKLCNHQVNNLEIFSKACFEKTTAGLDINIGQELRKIISLQDNEFSDEFIKNLKMMVNMGVIDQTEFQTRMKVVKVAIPSNSTDNSDAQNVHTPAPTDSDEHEVAEADGGEAVMVSAEEVEPHTTEIAELPILQPVQSSMHLHNSLEGQLYQTSTEVRDMQLYVTDSGNAEAVTLDTAAIVSEIENELRQATQDFDIADATVEGFVASRPLEELLSQAGYTATSSNESYITSVQSTRRDPTLPQNRPNTEHDIIEESPWSTNEVTLLEEWESREPTQQELKYYLMLDCLEEEDLQRGGPGRLNLEEFEAIMNGPRGGMLNFTGMFFDMVNF